MHLTQPQRRATAPTQRSRIAFDRRKQPVATSRGWAPSHRRARRGRVPGKEQAATFSSRLAASCQKRRRPTRSRRAFRLSNADRSNKPLLPRCSTFSPMSLAFQSRAQAASEARFICAGSVRTISARRSNRRRSLSWPQHASAQLFFSRRNRTGGSHPRAGIRALRQRGPDRTRQCDHPKPDR